MGTHPIFESDFDCLTEMSSVMSHGQLQVPPGLPSALESLARAVLKEQPDDLPKFAAAHFQALLRQREASGNDPFTSSAAINEETLPPKFENHCQNRREFSPQQSKRWAAARQNPNHLFNRAHLRLLRLKASQKARRRTQRKVPIRRRRLPTK